MPDYKQGKIYAIKSPNTDQVYIGSTVQSLQQRFFKHKHACKKRAKMTLSHVIIDVGNAYIELIENYPCESKLELNRREGEIMRDTKNCCNVKIAGRTRKEYFKENYKQIYAKHIEYNKKHEGKIKEYHSEYAKKNKSKVDAIKKKHYEANKERIKAKGRERVKCECGAEVSRNGMSLHRKSASHSLFVQN